MKFIISILFLGVSLELAFCGSPAVIPDIRTCTSVHDINSSNGDYIKSLCFVDTHITQPEEVQYCLNIGMRLLTIEGSAEIPGISNYLSTNFPPDWSFYLDSRRNIDGVWTSGDPPQPLNPAVTPINDKGDDCIVILPNETFETLPCTNNYNFVCQYDRNLI